MLRNSGARSHVAAAEGLQTLPGVVLPRRHSNSAPGESIPGKAPTGHPATAGGGSVHFQPDDVVLSALEGWTRACGSPPGPGSQARR